MKEPEKHENQPLQVVGLVAAHSSNQFYGPTTSSSRELAKSVLADLCGPIKAVTPRTRKRKAERATVLTSTPQKKLLEEKEKRKTESACKSTKVKGRQLTEKVDKQKLVKKQEKKKTSRTTKENGGASKAVQKQKCKGKQVIKSHDMVPCATCHIRFCDDSSGKSWIQCQEKACHQWYHNECQGIEDKYMEKIFYCIACEYDSD